MIQILQNMQPLMTKLSSTFSNMNCMDFQVSPYVISEKSESGLLVFTTLTCALLYIEGIYTESDLFKKAKTDDELRKTLLLYRVLIPVGFDEKKFCEQLRTLLLNEKKRQLHGKKNAYIIFTTTACNARCYYCFEHGYAPVTMTEETALKTAGYIEAHADGEVTLTWFGGEPLVNTNAINTITDYLREHGIPYKSRIVTNSYLFTPDLIRTAKESWHLENAQITLDGTRENYNRIKAYANGDADAYTRVIGNIQALAESGVHISLYLTLSHENESDLYALLSELAPMIKASPERFSVLPNLLQQYGGTKEEDEMQQKLIAMKMWLQEHELAPESELPENPLINSCTADNPSMAVIQADGGLNRCDHIGESKPYGSIFEGETDSSVIQWWAERKPAIPECGGCVLYPQCIRLAQCEAKRFNCTEITRNDRISDILRAMESRCKYGINT